MLRLFNVKFAALFLANSVLYTLFLYTAKDEKNETKILAAHLFVSCKIKIYKKWFYAPIESKNLCTLANIRYLQPTI